MRWHTVIGIDQVLGALLQINLSFKRLMAFLLKSANLSNPQFQSKHLLM